MLVFCNAGKRKLSFTFRRGNVLAALPAIPLRDIPATGVRRPCSIPRFARQRHGTHVLLQGRQIAFERPCCHPRTSRRELSGGDGEKMMEEVRKMQNLTGEFVGTVMANALKMGESNACMKRIVAAPTAGACGVLPAVLITYEQFHKVPEAKMLEGMYIAAGVGQVIAERACITGAQGGCQAEIGSASCMAATAITYIRGGSTKQIFDAGAFALKSLLGLVCDPLGDLVEVPCIKRNVIGSVNAITASDMAMAGIESKVPLDEVIDAMAEVGDLLPCSLKETSQAGLAQTETGKKYMPES